MIDNGERSPKEMEDQPAEMDVNSENSCHQASGMAWWMMVGLLLGLVVLLSVLLVLKRRACSPDSAVSAAGSAASVASASPSEEPDVAPPSASVPSASGSVEPAPAPAAAASVVLAALGTPGMEAPGRGAGQAVVDVESKGESLHSFMDDMLWGRLGTGDASVSRQDVSDALDDAIDLYKSGGKAPDGRLLVGVFLEALEKASRQDGMPPKAEETRLELDSLRVLPDGQSVAGLRQRRRDLLISRDELGLSVSLPYGLSMRLILVGKGEFTLGSEDDDDGRGLHESKRKIRLSRDFWLGEHEVTRGEWKAVMGCVTSDRQEGDDCPMVFVNRYEALAFCALLNDLYGDKLPAGYGFSLPTCAQWEYASRGGAGGRDFRYSGGDNLGEVGWYSGNSDGRLHPVGRKSPNELGFYDMSGNAHEYCLDNWPDSEVSQDPLGEICTWPYGVRGGGYSSGPWGCRVSSFALMQGRHGRYGTVGFRLAVVPRLLVDTSDNSDWEDDESEDAGAGKGEDSEEQAGKAEKVEKKRDGELEKQPESADRKPEASDRKKDGEKKRRRRSSSQLLRTRSESLKHDSAETIDWKNRRLLQTREQLERSRQEADDEEDEEEKGRDRKGGRKHRRRSSAPLLQTREDLRREQERGDREDEEDEKDGKKRRRRSSAPLLQTREDLRREQERGDREDEEDEKEGKDGKDGKDGKKRRRRSSTQLLRTRGESLDHSRAETIDWKRRKLLQTREEHAEAQRKVREETEQKTRKTRREREERKRETWDLDRSNLSVDLGDAVEILLRRIVPGRMVLGSEEEGRCLDEAPRPYELESRLLLSQHEVTQELFWVVMGYNPSVIRGDGQRPVDHVTWEEAMTFCARLTRRFRDRLPSGYVFRLPTEDEWEFAARGGARGSVGCYSGGSDLSKLGWFVGNAQGVSHVVGLKSENLFGLHDMSGNVSEWCLTGCDRDDFGEVCHVTDRPQASTPYRIHRGGAWCFGSRFSRVSARFCSVPGFRGNYVGFRVALGRRIR